jgi:16S rRNA pseudouridine516 synthase
VVAVDRRGMGPVADGQSHVVTTVIAELLRTTVGWRTIENDMTRPLRIDRILANLGYASRTEAKVLIGRHRVRVDGRVVTRGEETADPMAVTLDGEFLDRPLGILSMLHKPLGYVCSHDEREGPRVFDLVPERWLRRNPQVISAGRLDKDSTGLIVITDDYPLVHRLTSPKRHVSKVYEVVVDGEITADTVERFAGGQLVMAEDPLPCRPAAVVVSAPNRASVTLTEGRNRQLRRMFAACGLHVEQLHRTAFGSLRLGDLPEGQWSDVEGPIG